LSAAWDFIRSMFVCRSRREFSSEFMSSRVSGTCAAINFPGPPSPGSLSALVVCESSDAEKLIIQGTALETRINNLSAVEAPHENLRIKDKSLQCSLLEQ
jgi:hypothetical protein